MTCSRLTAAAAILGVFVWLFWDALFRSHEFAFRDTPQFYAPLFQFVRAEWAAGRVPLWNPHANSGEPLLANSTSSVFYPGQLVFWLPLGFGGALKLYLLGHLLLAAGAAYYLARRWGGSVEGSALAGLSYAFSGSILFQYCNVAFMCSAAWLPLALAVGDALLDTRRLPQACLLSVVLALMVLAGDPQLAYEVGLLLGLYAWLLWRAERASTESGESQEAGPRRPPRQSRTKRS